MCALSVGVPVNDENIKSLFELVKAKNVVLGELKVKTEGLSPESLDMVRMMLPTVTSPVGGGKCLCCEEVDLVLSYTISCLFVFRLLEFRFILSSRDL